MKTAGIDIGTTTISGVVLEKGENGQAKILETKTVENGCFVETGNDWERIQYAKERVEPRLSIFKILLSIFLIDTGNLLSYVNALDDFIIFPKFIQDE